MPGLLALFCGVWYDASDFAFWISYINIVQLLLEKMEYRAEGFGGFCKTGI